MVVVLEIYFRIVFHRGYFIAFSPPVFKIFRYSQIVELF